MKRIGFIKATIIVAFVLTLVLMMLSISGVMDLDWLIVISPILMVISILVFVAALILLIGGMF